MAPIYVASIDTEAGPAAAIVGEGGVHCIPGTESVRAMLGDWDGWLARIDAGELEDPRPREECTFLPPILEPPNLYMVGANYADHVREMHGLAADAVVERPAGGPFFFLKPTSTLVGDGAAVVIGAGIAKLDWEVELAAVIGRRAHRVTEARALDHVAGYTIVNDISARDAFVRAGAEPPFTFDWLGQKGWATSAPCGPWLLPARDCPQPGSLGLRLRLNDELMQDSSTSEMLYSLEEQIAHLSRQIPLMPGDIISTGTCAGVGMARGRFLAPGDVIRCEIEGIGVLTNPVEEDR
jgi:2-keto-4-pentenoate hydratase/2-oxohepta-3-ene-1,7-dioic acid hydratase in catechol pathway